MLETRYVTLCSLYGGLHSDSNIRHYSYECKATAQERPYTSRPSRTQQLQNPRLMPKLSTEVPNDLLRTNGVADEILAKRDEERGRKRDLDGEDAADYPGYSPKRARSVSSHSTSSVSTISTNRSASASPDRNKRRADGNGRGASSESPPPGKSRKRRYSDSAGSYSGSSYSGDRRRSRSREWAEDRNIRRRRRESSPNERGRHRDAREHSRRDRRSRSADKSRIAKERRSMTPNASHDRSGRRSYRDREVPTTQSHASQPARSRQDPRARPEPPRERSLSPFSKRLALTQAMNLDR
ncbi:uncharacterized protein N7459_003638 [Penicillium hispanicum]|uniref:uncharacterized protein n=1 Tax=Penicillium hispanicum TaxID=1080232 RepID=UPI002540200D|nr:uncharacterized protein N7459_003638 [Penicillium hispanicum]KAJ5587873.1 hypothetical protein N7459_003638 [Penicillium hispanicum]